MEQARNLGEARRWVGWGIVGAVFVAVAATVWLCICAPDIRFLAPYPGAEWIVFPKPATFNGRPDLELATAFRMRWTASEVPTAADLVYRAFTRAVVRVNGHEVTTPAVADANWKSVVRVPVAGWLRRGENEIEINVANRRGPPALWARLDASGLRTGPGWEASYAGSDWRPALPASAPLPQARDGTSTEFARVDQAWARKWPTLLGLAAVVVAVGWLWRLWAVQVRSRQGAWAALANPAVVTLLAASGAWTLLLAHNAPLLPRYLGFDAVSHWDYIGDILKGHLPLADEGMVMYNPPLYYALCAGLVKATGGALTTSRAVEAVRGLACLGGLLQLILIAGILRHVFPDDRRAQALGLVFAASLPANLYLSHYVTNEWLVALFATAAIHATIRAIRAPTIGIFDGIAIGGALGLALATKVTALLVAPWVIGALAMKLWADRVSPVTMIVRLGALVATAIALCGWHYVRVWAHLGKPLVGAWDPESGLAWWQDQGYVTLAQFFRFGHALLNPIFSARYGFWDGVYSTWWGDALCGGAETADIRPPWDYALMTVGATLALVLTFLLAVGVIRGVRRFVRTPTPFGLLVHGLLLTFAAAFGFMYLKVPCYGELKGFYGLVAVSVAAIAFADASTAAWLARGWPARVLPAFMGVWALTTFATYWIDADSAQTHLLLGYDAKDATVAERHFAAATRKDPALDTAWARLVSTQLALGHRAEARATLDTALRQCPASVRLRAEAGLLVASPEAATQALAGLEPALAQSPNNAMAHAVRIQLLRHLGYTDELIAACRDALCTVPNGPTTHLNLGLALATRSGSEAEAREHLWLAFQLGSGIVENMEAAAWTLATHASARLRDGELAGRIARQVIQQTHDHSYVARLALAAAEADLGHAGAAAASAGAAASIAQSTGDAGLARNAQLLQAEFRSGRRYDQVVGPPP